jgi:hypothetical protein
MLSFLKEGFPVRLANRYEALLLVIPTDMRDNS